MALIRGYVKVFQAILSKVDFERCQHDAISKLVVVDESSSSAVLEQIISSEAPVSDDRLSFFFQTLRYHLLTQVDDQTQKRVFESFFLKFNLFFNAVDSRIMKNMIELSPRSALDIGYLQTRELKQLVKSCQDD